jgi:ABC-type nitrate/sulfonate/bicarbonate transport system permease component
MARLSEQPSARPESSLPLERTIGAMIAAAGALLARSLGIILLIVAWEAVARSGAVTAFLLPTFSATLERIWNDTLSGDLIGNLGVTIYRSLAGFLIATVLGVGLGTLMSRIRVIRWFFDPIISVGFPMPKIAFLPIVILWLGFYDVPKISMVAVEAIFPVVTATLIGIQGVERELLWSARNMGANEREVVWHVVVPAAFPQIMTGLQVALPIALIVAIVTEMLMGGYGVGGAMINASRLADSRGVFAGIVEIAVIGFIMVKGMALLRRRMLLWHHEALEPTTV